MITNEAIETILHRLRWRTNPYTAKQAVAALVTGGFSEPEAEEMVFTALGGCDVIVKGSDGVDRYEYSGKTVADVAAAMEK